MKFCKKQNAKRVTSIMLTLFMIIGLMPGNLFTVKAASATNIASGEVADGGVIANLETVTFTARQALSVVNMDPAAAVPFLMSQTVYHLNHEQIEKKLNLLDKIITQVPVWELFCRNDDEAAFVAHAAMTSNTFPRERIFPQPHTKESRL